MRALQTGSVCKKFKCRHTRSSLGDLQDADIYILGYVLRHKRGPKGHEVLLWLWVNEVCLPSLMEERLEEASSQQRQKREPDVRSQLRALIAHAN